MSSESGCFDRDFSVGDMPELLVDGLVTGLLGVLVDTELVYKSADVFGELCTGDDTTETTYTNPIRITR